MHSLRRERTFVASVSLGISAVLAHFVHAAWELFFTMRGLLPRSAAPAPATAYAPDAYRVVLPAIIEWLLRVVHPRDRNLVSAGIDFCCAFVSLMLLYAVAVRGFPMNHTRARLERWVVVLLFLTAVQFPMAWVVPWQRPETLPTALYLAFALYCCVRSADSAAWLIALLAATLWQGFVRADAAVIFGVGLIAAGALGRRPAQFRSRAATLGSGVGVVLIAGGVQAYLQLIRFPHLTYPPGTPVVQWRSNLAFHNLQTATIAVLPFLVLAIVVAVRRLRLGATEWAVLAASGLYLVLWFAVGVLAEVRIFVPYMLLLSVVAARTLAPWLVGSTQDPQSATFH